MQETKGVIDPLSGTKYFLFGGTAAGSQEGHTLLRNPGSFTLDGVGLWDFLGQQVNDDPSWTSHAAP
jgi:hypothetical protein